MRAGTLEEYMPAQLLKSRPDRRTEDSLPAEAPQQRISPITGEELQVKFLADSAENSLKH